MEVTKFSAPQDNQTQVEVIFNGYFAEESNDRDLLLSVPRASPRPTRGRSWTTSRHARPGPAGIKEARGVRGVPHFIRQPGKDPVQISGAQPPDVWTGPPVKRSIRV